MPAENTVLFEDARIIFRNFQGKEGQYNREGDRNFSVLVDEETAKAMLEDGWNIKYLKARDEDSEEQAILQVSVAYKIKPPNIVMITSGGRTPLGEDEVDVLDWADIRTADLIVRPYEWTVNGKTGIKAYLKSLFVTIEEDELERKYNNLDDLPARNGRTNE